MAPIRPTKNGVSKHEKLNHCQSVETSRNNQIWQNIVSRYRKKNVIISTKWIFSVLLIPIIFNHPSFLQT
jgi:hypothetical protein